MFTKIAEMLSPSIRRKEGFTLIELLIVVAIIAILAAIAIPQFSAYRRRGYNAAANSDLRNLRTAEEAMFADYQDYGSGSVAVGTGGTMTLTNSTSQTQTTGLSASVGAVAIVATSTVGGSTKNTSFIAKATHASGDRVFGADSDSSSLFWIACAVASNCVATDLSAAPTTAVSGTNDFGTWTTM